MLDFIICYKLAHDGLSPTYREIADSCELSSTSVVGRHVEKLIDLGDLRRAPGDRNGLMVTGGRWEPPGWAVRAGIVEEVVGA